MLIEQRFVEQLFPPFSSLSLGERHLRKPQQLLFELSAPIFLSLYRYLCQNLNRDVVGEIFALVLRLPTRVGEVGGGIIGSEKALREYLQKELFSMKMNMIYF